MAATVAGGDLGLPVVQTFHALGAVKQRHQGSADTSPPGRLAVESRLARSVDRVIASCRDEVRELLLLGGSVRRSTWCRAASTPPTSPPTGRPPHAGGGRGCSRWDEWCRARAWTTRSGCWPRACRRARRRRRRTGRGSGPRPGGPPAARPGPQPRGGRPGRVARGGSAGGAAGVDPVERRRRLPAVVRTVRHRPARGDGLRRARRRDGGRRAAGHGRQRRDRTPGASPPPRPGRRGGQRAAGRRRPAGRGRGGRGGADAGPLHLECGGRRNRAGLPTGLPPRRRPPVAEQAGTSRPRAVATAGVRGATEQEAAG